MPSNINVPVFQMNPGDAVAVTQEIEATVQDCVKREKAETVGTSVIEAAKHLSQLSDSLAKLTVFDFADRKLVDTTLSISRRLAKKSLCLIFTI